MIRQQGNQVANKSAKSDLGAIFMAIGFMVGATAIVFACDYFYYPVRDSIVASSYEPTTEMEDIIDELELTERGLRIFKATKPALQTRDDFNLSGCNDIYENRPSTLGCYDSTNIYIYDSENEDLDGLEESTAAHELLHAIWQRLKFYDTDRLRPLLDQVYTQHHEQFSDYMDGYSDDQYYTELHSVIGTEIPASQLPVELREHYESYFADYDKIYGYFEQYDGVLTQITAEVAALGEQIEQERAVIADREQYYTEAAEQLEQDIEDHNSRSEVPGDAEAYEAEYYELIARREALIAYYEETARLVDEINQKIRDYNTKALYHNDLLQSIDSKPQDF